MANTTNLNLYKPTRDDYISVSRDISENMQKIDDAYGAMDTAIGNLGESRAKNGDIAIVVTGSTSTKNISTGDFVVVKDSTISGITDGLYVAISDVVAGTNITSSNLSNTDTGNGGFNALKANIDALNDNIGTLSNLTTTAKESAVSAINEINSKADYVTIINLQQITSSYVTRNTYNSRKFSDYKMLVFTPYENNWARASCIVPTFVFENATGIDIRYYQGGELIEVDIKRTSDTSYDAKYIGTPPSGEGVFIYCFGLLGN